MWVVDAISTHPAPLGRSRRGRRRHRAPPRHRVAVCSLPGTARASLRPEPSPRLAVARHATNTPCPCRHRLTQPRSARSHRCRSRRAAPHANVGPHAGHTSTSTWDPPSAPLWHPHPPHLLWLRPRVVALPLFAVVAAQLHVQHVRPAAWRHALVARHARLGVRRVRWWRGRHGGHRIMRPRRRGVGG